MVKIHKGKRVRFPEDEGAGLHTVVCVLPHRDDLTPEDHAPLWFSKADHQLSRSEARMISRESARYGFSRNLDGTFGRKSGEALERLRLWCSVAAGDCFRGLERWANRQHGDARGREQFLAVQAVLEAQDGLLAAAAGGATTAAATTAVDIPEKLRRVSHRATRTARHFARMMGKADSYAMAQELDEMVKGEDADTVTTEKATVSSTPPRAAISSSRRMPQFRRFGFGAIKANIHDRRAGGGSTSTNSSSDHAGVA